MKKLLSLLSILFILIPIQVFALSEDEDPYSHVTPEEWDLIDEYCTIFAETNDEGIGFGECSETNAQLTNTDNSESWVGFCLSVYEGDHYGMMNCMTPGSDYDEDQGFNEYCDAKSTEEEVTTCKTEYVEGYTPPDSDTGDGTGGDTEDPPTEPTDPDPGTTDPCDGLSGDELTQCTEDEAKKEKEKADEEASNEYNNSDVKDLNNVVDYPITLDEQMKVLYHCYDTYQNERPREFDMILKGGAHFREYLRTVDAILAKDTIFSPNLSLDNGDYYKLIDFDHDDYNSTTKEVKMTVNNVNWLNNCMLTYGFKEDVSKFKVQFRKEDGTYTETYPNAFGQDVDGPGVDPNCDRNIANACDEYKYIGLNHVGAPIANPYYPFTGSGSEDTLLGMKFQPYPSRNEFRRDSITNQSLQSWSSMKPPVMNVDDYLDNENQFGILSQSDIVSKLNTLVDGFYIRNNYNMDYDTSGLTRGLQGYFKEAKTPTGQFTLDPRNDINSAYIPFNSTNRLYDPLIGTSDNWIYHYAQIDTLPYTWSNGVASFYHKPTESGGWWYTSSFMPATRCEFCTKGNSSLTIDPEPITGDFDIEKDGDAYKIPSETAFDVSFAIQNDFRYSIKMKKACDKEASPTMEQEWATCTTYPEPKHPLHKYDTSYDEKYSTLAIVDKKTGSFVHKEMLLFDDLENGGSSLSLSKTIGEGLPRGAYTLYISLPFYHQENNGQYYEASEPYPVDPLTDETYKDTNDTLLAWDDPKMDWHDNVAVIDLMVTEPPEDASVEIPMCNNLYDPDEPLRVTSMIKNRMSDSMGTTGKGNEYQASSGFGEGLFVLRHAESGDVADDVYPDAMTFFSFEIDAGKDMFKSFETDALPEGKYTYEIRIPHYSDEEVGTDPYGNNIAKCEFTVSKVVLEDAVIEDNGTRKGYGLGENINLSFEVSNNMTEGIGSSGYTWEQIRQANPYTNSYKFSVVVKDNTGSIVKSAHQHFNVDDGSSETMGLSGFTLDEGFYTVTATIPYYTDEQKSGMTTNYYTNNTVTFQIEVGGDCLPKPRPPKNLKCDGLTAPYLKNGTPGLPYDPTGLYDNVDEVIKTCIGMYPNNPSTKTEGGQGTFFVANYRFFPMPLPAYTVETKNQEDDNKGYCQTYTNPEQNNGLGEDDAGEVQSYSNYPAGDPTNPSGDASNNLADSVYLSSSYNDKDLPGPFLVGPNSFKHYKYRGRMFATEVDFEFKIYGPEYESNKNIEPEIFGTFNYELPDECFPTGADDEVLDYITDGGQQYCREIYFYMPQDSGDYDKTDLDEDDDILHEVPEDDNRVHFKNPGIYTFEFQAYEKQEYIYQEDLGKAYQGKTDDSGLTQKGLPRVDSLYPLEIGNLVDDQFLSEPTYDSITSKPIVETDDPTYPNHCYTEQDGFDETAFDPTLTEAELRAIVGPTAKKRTLGGRTYICYHDPSPEYFYWLYDWSKPKWYKDQ